MPWWLDRITQAFNPPVEPGQDIGTPFHTPITALAAGRVVSETYGGFGARVDIKTASGVDVYYQHLDEIVSGLKVGSLVQPGQALGLSGGQLSGGFLPNSPYNSTGPHIEVGIIDAHGIPRNPAGFIAAGPQDVGTGGGVPPGLPAASSAPTGTPGSSSGGGLLNITGPLVNIPDPVASFRDWLNSGAAQARSQVSGGSGFWSSNIIPLVVAGLIILVVLGSGQKTQTVPQPIPIPV